MLNFGTQDIETFAIERLSPVSQISHYSNIQPKAYTL